MHIQLARLISIHAAREGGDEEAFAIRFHMGISIHAAGEGGDLARGLVNYLVIRFQSTPPVRAATRKLGAGVRGQAISIHAAREGGDRVRRQNAQLVNQFQSTPPVRAATPSRSLSA